MEIESEKHDHGEHLSRVRKICAALPATSEKLSHGEPTFFVNDKVFTMFADNHHHDGHVAVWLPVAPGAQQTLIRHSPNRFFRPPYVGVRGWIGIELDQVNNDELASHILNAWRLTAPKRLRAAVDTRLREAHL